MFINFRNNISKVCLLTIMLVTPSVSYSIVFNFSGTASGAGIPSFLVGAPVTGSIELSDTVALPGAGFAGGIPGSVLYANLSIGGYDLTPQNGLGGRVDTNGSTFSSLYAAFENIITVNNVNYTVQLAFSGSPSTGTGNYYNQQSFTGGVLTGTWTTPPNPVTFNFTGTAGGTPPFPFSDGTLATGSITLTGASALPGASFSNASNAILSVGGHDLNIQDSLNQISGTVSADGLTLSNLTVAFGEETGIIVNSVNYGVSFSFQGSPTTGTGNSYNWNTNQSDTSGHITGTWAVPEPAALTLMSIGLAGIGFGKRRSFA